jgi:hypothetical protein
MALRLLLTAIAWAYVATSRTEWMRGIAWHSAAGDLPRGRHEYPQNGLPSPEHVFDLRCGAAIGRLVAGTSSGCNKTRALTPIRPQRTMPAEDTSREAVVRCRLILAGPFAVAVVLASAIPAVADHTHFRIVGNGECVLLAPDGGEKYVQLPHADDFAANRQHPLHVNVHIGQPGGLRRLLRRLWTGAGSIRRPSAFQASTA